MMTAWADWPDVLERSSFAEWVRTAPYLYPALESLHVIGIALLLGTMFIVDLRLLGVGHRVLPVTAVLRTLLPLALGGFALVVVTGVALFSSIAVSMVQSAAAPWKFGLVGLAGLNALAFHIGPWRRVAAWDERARTPTSARLAAGVSVACWMGTVVAGRFLAYA